MPSLPVTRMPCRSSTPKPAYSARSPRPTCWPTSSSTAEPTPYQSSAAPAAAAMPEGPWLYPEDQIADLPQRLLAAEITREKLTLRLHQELPYALTVETEGWAERPDGSIRIDQVIYVEREGQRKIMLGKDGQTIKAIGQAARRLSDPSHLQLCVVDQDMRLVGILTRRNLLSVYRRSDDRIDADVTAAIQADLRRPGRTPAAITVHVDHGVVTLQGTLTYRSGAEHAGYAASRVAGVVAIRNKLSYEVDDLMITGL